MIKPDMIPDEVVEAAREAWDGYYNFRKSLAAALSAWPRVFGTELEDHTGVYRKIILPLPTETSDSDWGKPVGKEEW